MPPCRNLSGSAMPKANRITAERGIYGGFSVALPLGPRGRLELSRRAGSG